MTQRSIDTPWLPGRWRPASALDLAVPMPDGTVRWLGRTYDLSSTTDLVDLSAALADADDASVIVDMLDAETAAANAEADRYREEIKANELKAAAFQAANDASGMTAAQERAAQWLSGDARADAIAQHRRQYGEPWRASSPRFPQTRTLSSLPALSTTDENRAEQIREHRRNAGI